VKVKWRSTRGLQPEVLLAELKNVALACESGGLAFPSVEHVELTASLYSMLHFERGMAAPDRDKVFSRAVSSAVLSQALDRKSFVAQVNRELNQSETASVACYRLLSSISLGDPLPFRKIRVRDSLVHFVGDKFPGRFASRKDYEAPPEGVCCSTPADFERVVVEVTAKDIPEAQRKSLEVLELLRAALSLQLDEASIPALGADGPTGAPLKLGPLHTLHDPKGECLGAPRWQESNDCEVDLYRAGKDSAPQLRRDVTSLLERMQRSCYGEQIEAALIRYVQALDQRDDRAAARGLWSVLELLAMDSGGNRDQVCQRCSALYRAADRHRESLRRLRDIGKAAAEPGSDAEDWSAHRRFLQSCFLDLLKFHIRECSFFISLQEANFFLDLPRDLASLNRRQQVISRAIRYRS
jgi:hypothetical protein